MSNTALSQDAIEGKYTNFSAVASSGKVKPKEIQEDCPQLDLKRSSLKSRHPLWKVQHTEQMEYIHEAASICSKGAEAPVPQNEDLVVITASLRLECLIRRSHGPLSRVWKENFPPPGMATLHSYLS